jgi:D-3-phosphoglycerate dehydrogenase
VGFGLIAQHVAQKARAFGMRVIVWARRQDVALADRNGVVYAGLDDVFSQADVLSLHLPLNPDTAGIASRSRLSRMKRTAILVNVSRGALVDEAALAELLASHRLLGAGLDVLATEPPGPRHPLATFDNVVLTPHCAWYSEEGRDDVERRTARSAVDVLQGIEPASWVNPEARLEFESRWGPLRPRSRQGENA